MLLLNTKQFAVPVVSLYQWMVNGSINTKKDGWPSQLQGAFLCSAGSRGSMFYLNTLKLSEKYEKWLYIWALIKPTKRWRLPIGWRLLRMWCFPGRKELLPRRKVRLKHLGITYLGWGNPWEASNLLLTRAPGRHHHTDVSLAHPPEGLR